MTLFGLLGKNRLNEAAYAMYREAGEQSRRPAFFGPGCVADSFDGRFDLLVIHVHLLVRRLRRLEADAKKAQQELFDVFISDLDQGLRLSGVGDIGIGHRVKKMTHAYYGRAVAYDAALDALDRTALRDALHRNLYRLADLPDGVLDAVTDYVMSEEARLGGLDDRRLLAGELDYPVPPDMERTE